MIIREVHQQVEQLLQEQGIFGYKDFSHEEIDMAWNFVSNELVSLVTGQTGKDGTVIVFAEANQYFTDVTRIIKSVVTLAVSSKEEVSGWTRNYVNLPENYSHLVSDVSNITKTCGGKEVTSIKSGYRYVASAPVKYKGVWYKKDEVFIGGDEEGFYPSNVMVKELPRTSSANRLKRSEDIGWLLKDSLHTSCVESPISEIVQNVLIVYSNEFYVDSLLATYYIKIPKVNFLGQVNPIFTDDVCYFLIRKTYQHLKAEREKASK